MDDSVAVYSGLGAYQWIGSSVRDLFELIFFGGFLRAAVA